MKKYRRIRISYHYELWRQFRSQVDDNTWLLLDRTVSDQHNGAVFELEELLYEAFRSYYQA